MAAEGLFCTSCDNNKPSLQSVDLPGQAAAARSAPSCGASKPPTRKCSASRCLACAWAAASRCLSTHRAARALPSSAQAPSVWRLMTWSPGLKRVTSGPTAVTVPAASLPGMNGGSGRNWYLPASISTSTSCTHQGGDADGDLAGSGRRRVGHVAQREDLGAAECFADHGFHGWVPCRGCGAKYGGCGRWGQRAGARSDMPVESVSLRCGVSRFVRWDNVSGSECRGGAHALWFVRLAAMENYHRGKREALSAQRRQRAALALRARKNGAFRAQRLGLPSL